MLINGLSAGFMFMPITAIVLGGVEPEHAGSASGLLQTTQQLGGAVGLAVIVLGVRRGRGPGRVPARRPGGVPHLGGHSALAGLRWCAALAALRSPRGRPSWSSSRWLDAGARRGRLTVVTETSADVVLEHHGPADDPCLRTELQICSYPRTP